MSLESDRTTCATELREAMRAQLNTLDRLPEPTWTTRG